MSIYKGSTQIKGIYQGGTTQIKHGYISGSLVYSFIPTSIVTHPTLPTNLFACYNLDSDLNDVIGGVNSNGSNAITYGTGKLGNSAILNGTSSYARFPDNTNNRLTGNYTIAFWLNWSGNTAMVAQRLITKDNANDSSGGYSVYIQNSKLVYVHNYGTSGYYIGPDTSLTDISTSVWQHYIVTYDGTNIKIYQNGSLKQSITATINCVGEATNSLFFGTYGADTALGQYLNGKLDQVLFWSRAITATEASDLYNSGNGLPYN